MYYNSQISHFHHGLSCRFECPRRYKLRINMLETLCSSTTTSIQVLGFSLKLISISNKLVHDSLSIIKIIQRKRVFARGRLG